MNTYIKIKITKEMLDDAIQKVNEVSVNRTIASKIDTLTGIIGEYVFAQYFFDDWRKNRVGENKGDVDFKDIEIKTSSFPFSEKLNLLVREDYAIKRKPPYYVQIIIDVQSRTADSIQPNTDAFICGWATADEVDNAPKRDMGSKLAQRGGYKCHYINIKQLNDMENFKENFRKH